MEHDLSTQRNWYHTKFISLTFFVTIDSYLNSKSEYEALQPSLSDLSDYDKDHHDSSIDTITQLQIIFFGCSILVQVSIFAVFFLILCDTYPFQIGLISVLTSRFKFPILTHQVYVSLGIIIGVMVGVQSITVHLIIFWIIYVFFLSTRIFEFSG